MDPKTNKIAIIGDSGLPEKFFEEVKAKKRYPEVTVIDNEPEPYTITINGNKYRHIHRESRSSKKGSMLMAMTLALAGSVPGLGSSYTRKHPQVDIPTEYGLIELKQSKLSRNDRDWVVYQFNLNYTITLKH